MDKKGFIQEHSKIKLELYRLYLERYLSVLLATPFFERIIVSDVFAGCGVSQNEQRGSALIAAETIEKIKIERNPRHKEVILNLNDVNQENCLALQKHLQNRLFVNITNQDADQYIQSWKPISGSHNFFFIDPHGYTQVSIDNLKRLFSMERSEFLIFMPIYHIYRFRPKGLGLAQTKPVEDFLKDLGINDEDTAKADDPKKFSDLIRGALQRISKSDMVYTQIIENRVYNSRYCLFFITHNIRGAEKFLEAQHELKKEIKATAVQPAFDFGPEELLLDFINRSKSYDNIELYELAIKAGIRPQDAKNELKKLENEGRISVVDILGKRRLKKGFYINFEHYKMRNRIVSVTFKG